MSSTMQATDTLRQICRRVLVVGVLSLVWNHPVEAQLPELNALLGQCAPEITEHRNQALVVDGDSGVWFHLEVARCMKTRLDVLPELIVQLRLYESRRDASEALEATLRRLVDVSAQEAEIATNALSVARRALHRAEEDRNRWYRSPILWFVIGAIVAGALVGLSAYALGATGD